MRSGLVAIPFALGAQTPAESLHVLRVVRAVNLRPTASTDSAPIRLLSPGTELHLAEMEPERGFYAVETGDGNDGWVFAANVVPRDKAGAVGAPVKAKSRALVQPLVPKCTKFGDAAPGSRDEATDKLKVRTADVSTANVDGSVSLTAMLAPGADQGRFDQTHAATIEAFVLLVKPGGPETVNCHGSSDTFDAHFELVAAPKNTLPKEVVIAEVTPQLRKLIAGKGGDWSTDRLKTELMGKHVRITGWLLQDWRHAGVAQNSGKPTTKKERATMWEIHPITRIQIQDAGVWRDVK